MKTGFENNNNYNPEHSFTQIKFGYDRPVLENDLNQLQQIQDNKTREIIKTTLNNGIINIFQNNNIPDIIYNPEIKTNGIDRVQTLNSIAIAPMKIALNGYIINAVDKNSQVYYKDVNFDNGNEIQLTDYIIVTLPEAPQTGLRTDLVYLRVWLEEIDKDDALYKNGYVNNNPMSNNIIDPRIQIETSRRVAIHWQICTLQNYTLNKQTNIIHSGQIGDNLQNDNIYPITPSELNKIDTILLPAEYQKFKNCSFFNDNNLWIESKINGSNSYSSNITTDTTYYNTYSQVVTLSINQLQDNFISDVNFNYVFTMPLFEIKRRNKSEYNIMTNSNGAVAHSDAINLRPDNKYYDFIYSDDLVDQRRCLSSIDNLNYYLDNTLNKLFRGQLNTNSKSQIKRAQFGTLSLEKEYYNSQKGYGNIPNLFNNIKYLSSFNKTTKCIKPSQDAIENIANGYEIKYVPFITEYALNINNHYNLEYNISDVSTTSGAIQFYFMPFWTGDDTEVYQEILSLQNTDLLGNKNNVITIKKTNIEKEGNIIPCIIFTLYDSKYDPINYPNEYADVCLFLNKFPLLANNIYLLKFTWNISNIPGNPIEKNIDLNIYINNQKILNENTGKSSASTTTSIILNDLTSLIIGPTDLTNTVNIKNDGCVIDELCIFNDATLDIMSNIIADDFSINTAELYPSFNSNFRDFRDNCYEQKNMTSIITSPSKKYGKDSFTFSTPEGVIFGNQGIKVYNLQGIKYSITTVSINPSTIEIKLNQPKTTKEIFKGEDLIIVYSILIPAGYGINELPNEVLDAELIRYKLSSDNIPDVTYNMGLSKFNGATPVTIKHGLNSMDYTVLISPYSQTTRLGQLGQYSVLNKTVNGFDVIATGSHADCDFCWIAVSSNQNKDSSSNFKLLHGSDVFNSSTGTVITHDLNIDPLTYNVLILPKDDNLGRIGEYYIKDKTVNSFTICCTGTDNFTIFDWVLCVDDRINTTKNKPFVIGQSDFNVKTKQQVVTPNNLTFKLSKSCYIDILPIDGSGGLIGDYWITNILDDSFTVCFTGASCTTKFDWVIFNPDILYYKQEAEKLSYNKEHCSSARTVKLLNSAKEDDYVDQAFDYSSEMNISGGTRLLYHYIFGNNTNTYYISIDKNDLYNRDFLYINKIGIINEDGTETPVNTINIEKIKNQLKIELDQSVIIPNTKKLKLYIYQAGISFDYYNNTKTIIGNICKAKYIKTIADGYSTEYELPVFDSITEKNGEILLNIGTIETYTLNNNKYIADYKNTCFVNNIEHEYEYITGKNTPFIKFTIYNKDSNGNILPLAKNSIIEIPVLITYKPAAEEVISILYSYTPFQGIINNDEIKLKKLTDWKYFITTLSSGNNIKEMTDEPNSLINTINRLPGGVEFSHLIEGKNIELMNNVSLIEAEIERQNDLNIYNYRTGMGTFNSNSDDPATDGRVVYHNLNIDLLKYTYNVLITSREDTTGSIGEYYIKDKTANSFTICCSGTNNFTSFDWIVCVDKITNNNKLTFSNNIPYKLGTGQFAGPGGVIINHNLNIIGDYFINVIQSKKSEEDVGDYWIDGVTPNSFTVYNTGQNPNNASFDWTLFASESINMSSRLYYKIGYSSFTATVPKTITHNLNITNYKVLISPYSQTDGALGQYYITNIKPNSFDICTTSMDAVCDFCWIVINDRSSMYTYKSGSGIFNSTNGAVINHNLGVDLLNKTYNVMVIPKDDNTATIGEIFIADKQSDCFSVYNTGKNNSAEFEWVIYVDDIINCSNPTFLDDVPYKLGTAEFNGNLGMQISHNLNITGDYIVFIIPSMKSIYDAQLMSGKQYCALDGAAGDYWIGNITSNSFTVYNSGIDNISTFDWIIFNPAAKTSTLSELTYEFGINKFNGINVRNIIHNLNTMNYTPLIIPYSDINDGQVGQYYITNKKPNSFDVCTTGEYANGNFGWITIVDDPTVFYTMKWDLNKKLVFINDYYTMYKSNDLNSYDFNNINEFILSKQTQGIQDGKVILDKKFKLCFTPCKNSIYKYIGMASIVCDYHNNLYLLVLGCTDVSNKLQNNILNPTYGDLFKIPYNPYLIKNFNSLK